MAGPAEVSPVAHLSPRAKRDVLEIWSHIATDNVRAADKMVDLFNEKVLMLAESPGMGRMRPELGRSIRSFPVGNYLIFYRPRRDGVEIARILHGARDLRRIFRRKA